MKHLQYHLNKIFIFLVLLSLLFIPNKVFAIKNPTSNFYVNDYANVLSESVENYIVDNSLALYNEDKTQIVVSIVNSLEGLTIEEYALEMFRNFGIGDKEENNGLLILLSISDRETRIEVGYGLEGIINDSKAGRIIDNYMIPYFSNDNWEEGIKKGYDAIFAEIVSKKGLELNYDKKYIDNETDDFNIIIYFFLGFLVISITLIYININFGKKLRSMKSEKSKKIARIYLIILVILFLIIRFINSIKLISLLILFKIVSFILGYFGFSDINYTGRGYFGDGRNYSSRSSFGSYRSSSSSRSSSGSYQGGGGSSGGGGASRKF